MADFRIRRWEDYTYDRTGSGVLRNLRGYTDSTQLTSFENNVTQLRIAELVEQPVDGDFDHAHMQQIHRRIFQDVYPWAGETRIGPPSPARMTKSGPDVSAGPDGPLGPQRVYEYFPGDYIQEPLDIEYRKISDQRYLTGMTFDDFIVEFSERWAEINVIHAFREGNTRSQFVFFRQLAEEAGWRLDTDQFRIGSALRDEFVHARFYAHIRDSSWLASVLAKAVGPLDVEPELNVDADPIIRLGAQPRLGDRGASTQRGRFTHRTRTESPGGLRNPGE